MSVTIYEIAEKAGVSSSTVARILRGDAPGVYRRSAETASRIQRLADEMGYRPNMRAKAFSRGRTHGIGLLYTDDAWIFEGVNTHVVNSLVRSLQHKGYHLVFAPIDSEGTWQEIVLGGQIDGGVVFQKLPDEVHDALRERGLPLILLGDNSDPSVSQVVVDDFSGGYSATKHLIGLGHRRIVMFVHEDIKQHCSVEERRKGYRSAMDEAGLEPNECLNSSAGEVVDLLVRGDDRPTAVVCYSDLESTFVVHGLWQFGVNIPREVSVVGFNDVFSTQYMTPPLTSVRFDAAKIGELGAEMVLREMNSTADDRELSVISVRPELIVRGSTGPVVNTRNSVELS